MSANPAVSASFLKFWSIDCRCIVYICVKNSLLKNCCVLMRCCISGLEYIPIDCKSIFGLRAIALMLSGENFFSGCINVQYGVSR